MNPRSGIAMSGQKVNITGTNGFALGDAWGAVANAMLGGLTLTGRFVKLANVNKFAELFLHEENLFEMIQGITLVSGSLKQGVTAEQLARCGWGLGFAQTLIKDVESVWPFVSKIPGIGSLTKPYEARINQSLAPSATPSAATSATPSAEASVNLPPGTSATQPSDTSATPLVDASTNTSDEASANPSTDTSAKQPVADVPAPLLDTGEPIEALLLCLNMALNITNVAYQIVETTYADLWLKDTRRISKGEEAKRSIAQKTSWRDKLYLSSMVIDHGIIDAALDVAMVFSIAKSIPGSSAEIRMRPSGDLVLKGARQLTLYGTTKDEDAVAPSFIRKGAMTGINAVTATMKLAADVVKWAATGPAAFERVKPWLEKL
jgi:hypothetical protein